MVGRLDLTDVQFPSLLCCGFVHCCFSEKHSFKMRSYFLDILSCFIVEQETMPQQVLDSILMQLTEEMVR